jgi:predicted AAA+ superfamily ATPase
MHDKIAILRRYNFWNAEFPDMGLPRENYLEKINGFIGNRLIKVLVGQRRSGKSYLLRQIIHSLIIKGVNPVNILYINKEYTDFDLISNYTELEELIILYQKELKPKGKIFLFVDEVQRIAGWEHLINSYSQNYTREYEVFISGSNSKLLSAELATLLSGRYIQFQILPFSYLEFISIKKKENTRASFLEYLNSGGLPELFHLPDDETRRHYLSAIKDTVLLHDIIQRYKIKDIRLLEDIFSFLVNNASNLISINNIVKYFAGKNRKTNYETVANYINYLQNTFLIHQVNRFSIKGKEVLAGTHKYYINDLSFKNYLYTGFEYGYGYMLENIIYLQLINAGYNVYTGFMRNKEIDFVAIKSNKTIYIQVAYLLVDKETILREYAELEAIPDNYQKFVVSLDDMQLADKNGIRHVLAWKINEVL